MQWVGLGIIALVVSTASCGGHEVVSALAGTWTYTPAKGGAQSITVTLNADGTAEEVAVLGKVHGTYFGEPMGDSGTLTTTGLTWNSTASTLTLGGSPVCSGTYSIGGRTPRGCAYPLELPDLDDPSGGGYVTTVFGACDASLSADGATLTLAHCQPTLAGPSEKSYVLSRLQ
jgi:hypothetical protein